MPDLRKQEDDRSKEHWAFVEATANKVGNWPIWKQAAALTATETERQKDVEDCKVIGQAYAAD